MEENAASSPRDYFAAERTVLAWIRTGLALMGFGFVVARFGLFLQELQVVQPNLALRVSGLSPWFGTALIVLGVTVNLVSCWRYTRQIDALKTGTPAFARPSVLALTVAVLLAALGTAMAVYLLSLRDPNPSQPNHTQEKAMTPNSQNGVVTVPSSHSVDQTAQKLEAILQAKGVKLFTLVDHSGEAEKAGMHMPPTKLLIFGNPKAGTPLMLASPTIAIDLPLKLLVWEDGSGRVWISYNAPSYLQARHNLPQELTQNIAVVEALAASAAK